MLPNLLPNLFNDPFRRPKRQPKTKTAPFTRTQPLIQTEPTQPQTAPNPPDSKLTGIIDKGKAVKDVVTAVASGTSSQSWWMSAIEWVAMATGVSTTTAGLGTPIVLAMTGWKVFSLVRGWRRRRKKAVESPASETTQLHLNEDGHGDFQDIIDRLRTHSHRDDEAGYQGDEVQDDGTTTSTAKHRETDDALELRLYKEAVAVAASGKGSIKQFGGRIIGQAILDYISTRYARIKGVHKQGASHGT